MNEFVIVSDSTVDLPKEYLQAKQVPIISLSYIMDGVTYEEMDGLSHKEFFEKLRTGSLPTTSQINPEQAREALEPLAKEGKDKEITILHFGLWFVHYALYALIPFFAVLFGSDAVQRILEMIPDVIMNGLTVAGNMLPAVGMAMLLQMLWNNKIAIYFLLGFILVAYLDLPLIAIAVLGTIIAVVTAQRDMQLKNNQAAPAAAVEKMSEEEDFFA